MNRLFTLFLAGIIALSACTNAPAPVAYSDFESELQYNINNAKEGDVIELPEGKFSLPRRLELKNVKNLTIRGKGKDKTFLDFGSKQDTLECFDITADGAMLENFSITNLHNNAILSHQIRGVTIRDLQLNFDSAAKTNATGIIVIECKNVLIQGCEVAHANGSGISLVLSSTIITRQNNIHHNATGIESENCKDVDIYDNGIVHNGIAILASHSISTSKKNNDRYRIFNNRIEYNNLEVKSQPATLAAEIPTGTGIVLVAINTAEINGNGFIKQQTCAVALLSSVAFQKPGNVSKIDYCSGIGAHDNRITTDSTAIPNERGLVGKLLANVYGKNIPNLIYDGYFNPAYLNADGSMKEEHKICFHNNSNGSLGDMDLPGRGAHRTTNNSKYDCILTPLIEVKLN